MFRFWSKFVSFTQSIQATNTIFENPALSFFSIYGKMSCKKLRKFTESILRKMRHKWTDRWTDKRTDFIGPLLQRWGFDHVFRKFDNKIFINHLACL